MNQKKYTHPFLKLITGFACALVTLPLAFAGNGGSGSGWSSGTSQVYDTSYAVEASASCLTGGCHEKNTTLLTGYKTSYMTHVMVKCNACHGTHTAAEVGKPKPSLTGYVSGLGATGYKVPKDRCLVCHSSMLNSTKHPRNPSECLSCHSPHVFAPPKK